MAPARRSSRRRENDAAKRAGYLALAAGLGAIAAGGLLFRRRRPPVRNRAVPEPARPVDLERYMGRWYEIARYENRFERALEEVTADYRLQADGIVEVINRGVCPAETGARHESVGKARQVPESGGAKLKVSFFGPFFGDYWVLDHADDYSWSIVGEPKGRYLWLLTREPEPGPELWEQLLKRVNELGYDDSALRHTRQRS